jgi:hypothetical protein
MLRLEVVEDVWFREMLRSVASPAITGEEHGVVEALYARLPGLDQED